MCRQVKCEIYDRWKRRKTISSQYFFSFLTSLFPPPALHQLRKTLFYPFINSEKYLCIVKDTVTDTYTGEIYTESVFREKSFNLLMRLRYKTYYAADNMNDTMVKGRDEKGLFHGIGGGVKMQGGHTLLQRVF